MSSTRTAANSTRADAPTSPAGLAKIEKEHEQRYKRLLENLQSGRIFAKPQRVKWRCRNCGFVHEGEKAAQMCPVCKHPQAYFEVVADGF